MSYIYIRGREPIRLTMPLQKQRELQNKWVNGQLEDRIKIGEQAFEAKDIKGIQIDFLPADSAERDKEMRAVRQAWQRFASRSIEEKARWWFTRIYITYYVLHSGSSLPEFLGVERFSDLSDDELIRRFRDRVGEGVVNTAVELAHKWYNAHPLERWLPLSEYYNLLPHVEEKVRRGWQWHKKLLKTNHEEKGG